VQGSRSGAYAPFTLPPPFSQSRAISGNTGTDCQIKAKFLRVDLRWLSLLNLRLGEETYFVKCCRIHAGSLRRSTTAHTVARLFSTV